MTTNEYPTLSIGTALGYPKINTEIVSVLDTTSTAPSISKSINNFNDLLIEYVSHCPEKELEVVMLYIEKRMTYREYQDAKRAEKTKNTKQGMLDKIEKVIFNDPATIVIWTDGTKTVVKSEGEKFDPEKGLAMAISKKLLGNNNGYYYEVFKKWVPKKKTHSKKVVLKAVEKVRKDFDKEQVVGKYKY